MIFPNKIHSHQKTYLLFTLILVSSGCSSLQEKKDKAFDSSQVKEMLFQLDQTSELLNPNLPKLEISTQVANNLAGWGFKVKGDKLEDYSHSLSVEIGKVQTASTPAGFSFSMGNSDPRSIDFQKADVLPMTCYLSPKNQSGRSAELSASVTAKDYVPYLKQQSINPKLINTLINDMSTICFNLLTNLKINTHQDSTFQQTSKPDWIPEIRVEIENDVEPTSMKTSTTTHSDSDKTQKKIKPEPRKRIIIHNQGTPVIFKFGHERK